MNCPQCQEQLDERLDELRSGLRDGSLSLGDARSLAQKALEEAVTQCSECESELRAHLALRLSLMIPDSQLESVPVPPALRANVRRALEREKAPPTYPARNPFKGLVWTGGAVFSAVALFIIARPFLMERAQTPPVASLSTGTETSPPLSQSSVPKGSTPLPRAKSAIPGKPPVGTRPAPSKPNTGPVSPSAPGKVTVQSPQVGLAPTRGGGRATGGAALTVPSVRSTAPQSSGSGAGHGRTETESTKPAPREAPSVHESTPRPPAPVVGASAPSRIVKPPRGFKPRPPAEPRLDSHLLAPSGAALGLAVRFVPASRANKPMMAAPARVPDTPQSSSPPAGVAPPPAKVQPGQEGTTNPEAVSPPPAQDAARTRKLPDTSAEPPAMADSVPNSAEATARSANTAPVTGNLSVSVNTAVTNARVVGQVEGREGEGMLLWSGNAPARKPITVPLEPLAAHKGDTVNVSFQQQVSLGETKTLATTSVVVP